MAEALVLPVNAGDHVDELCPRDICEGKLVTTVQKGCVGLIGTAACGAGEDCPFVQGSVLLKDNLEGEPMVPEVTIVEPGPTVVSGRTVEFLDDDTIQTVSGGGYL